MSIAEFTSAIKDKAYTEWFKKSSKSILIQTTTELRPSEQTAQKTALLLTKQDISNIAVKLAGREVTQQELDTVYNDLVSSVKRNRVIIRKDKSLLFPVIDFENGINNVLKKGFDSLPKATVTDTKSGKEREARVSDFFQRGHVFSIATNVTEQTKRNLAVSKAPDFVKQKILPILEEYVNKLKADDLASSNVKDMQLDLYAKYSKNPYKYLVEMQPVEVNQASGRASAPLTNALRRYFDPANYVSIDKFFRTRATEDSFIQKLITTKGSPSYIDLVTEELTAAIKGSKRKNRSYSIPTTKVDSIKIPVDTTEVRKTLKTNIANAEKLARSLREAAAQATKIQQEELKASVTIPPTAGLLALLNAKLFEQIQKNMGTGNETKVLNFRSGRFAESARVERLSVSREGMVSAFYSYMRNPYGTFSEGGKQQYPRTRDPKTLISKSIREIGATMVGNRMRSVLV